MSELFLKITLAAYAASTVGYFFYLIFEKKISLLLSRGGLGCGFLLHTLSLILGHASATQVWNFSQREAFSFFAWLLVGGFFLVGMRIKVQIMGCFIPPLAFLFGVASLSVQRPVEEVIHEPLRSGWFPFHVIGSFVGEALFALTAILAVLYLAQERQLKSRRPGFLLQRLPSLQVLDRMIERILKWGFLFLTVGLLAGGIWAHTALSTSWRLDPKQFWAIVTWILYAVILHLRIHYHLSGRKGALLAVLGSIVVFFTFVGTNMVYGESHNFWKI